MNNDLLVLIQVIISSFSEVSENEYLDPKTAQVAIVDHVKQVSSLPVILSCTCLSLSYMGLDLVCFI